MVQPDEYGTIEEMLPEYFEGTLTAKNKAIVEQWIAASEENEQAAWQFYSLYMAIDTASVMERVDTAQALKTVNRRLQRKAFYSITTTLIEGKLGFVFRDEQKHKQTILKPYEKLTYHTTGKRQLELQKTDGEVETSWKEGKIIFNNTPFKEAVRMLEKRYAVVFDIKNPKLYRHAFTGTFTNQRVERILEFFRLSSHVHWKYVNMEKFNDERSIIELY